MGRPARRAAIAATFIAVTFAGGVATGLTGDDSNGRDGGTQPGAPSDQPTVVPVDADDAGRSGPEVVSAPNTRLVETLSVAEATTSRVADPTDNGRGGLDPSAGPLPVARIRSSTEAIQSLDSGSYDTDSGMAPEPPAKQTGRGTDNGLGNWTQSVEAERSAPVDQDVPGAPTGGPPGADLPSNDADG